MNSLTEDKRLAKKIYRVVDKNKDTKKILAKNNKVIYKEDNFVMTTYIANFVINGKDSSENENSIITFVKNGQMSMLFTGDSGIKAFNKLKYELSPNITVLKVGHHGAKNVINKEMMNYLNPKVSLVSVGYNRYGHPNPVTMKILERSKIIRTDRMNSIKIVAKKNDYEIYGFDSKLHKYYKRFERKY